MLTVLQKIFDALESWAEQILDFEEKSRRSTDIRKDVFNSLNRQVLDGFISEQHSKELQYTCDLWLNLYEAFLCKFSGESFSHYNVLMYLINLYSLNRITKDFFIDIVMELYKN